MLTFLQTTLAWALAAAAIPLLIHLLTRNKLKKVDFSSLHFLKQLQNVKMRRVRFKQILLLILRTLILICIILAFMRPTLKNQQVVLSRESVKTTIFIIDNSLSMAQTSSGTSLFAQAKNRAMEVMRTMENGQQIQLIRMAKPVRKVGDIIVSANDQENRRGLDQMTQTESAADFDASLQLTQEIIAKNANVQNDIFVFSDQQFPEPKTFTAPEQFFINTYFCDLAIEDAHDLAVQDISIENQIFELGKVLKINARVYNSGQFDENNRIISLYANDKRVAQNQVSVPKGESRAVTFNYAPQTGGLHLLRAGLENDQLTQNNHQVTAFYLPESLHVLLVRPRPDNSVFLKNALRPDPQKTHFVIEETSSLASVRQNLQHFDVIVSANVPRFSASDVAALETHLGNGGGLVVFLGEDVDLRDYSESIFSEFNVGSILEAQQLNQQTGTIRFGEVNFSHPLFATVFDQSKSPKIESPNFNFFVNMQPHTNSRSIISYSNQKPFLLETKVESGTMLTCLTSADASWSDMNYRALFAPLVYRMVSYLGGGKQDIIQLIETGEPTQAQIKSQNLNDWQIETAAENTVRIAPEVVRNKLSFSFAETSKSGFYHLQRNGQRHFTWAAQFSPQEMQQPPLDFSVFEDRLTGFQPQRIGAEQTIENFLAQQWHGSEIWHVFILLALVGLVAEMLIFRTKPND